jgi:histidine ammonia-lyase
MPPARAGYILVSVAGANAEVEEATVTISLTGSDLTIDGVLAVARDGEPVALDPAASNAMVRTRNIVDATLARGETVYGLTTGVGVLQRVAVAASGHELAAFNRSLIDSHRVAQGPEAPRDVVRAALVCLANTLARGSSGVRPVLVERAIDALNGGREPTVRILGSVGQADLAANADLAAGFLDDLELAPGEGLAVLNNNAFSVGWGALALADASRLITTMEASAALALEGFEGSLTPLHAAVAEARPYEGLASSLGALRRHLEGSRLFEPGVARNLQDPLCFRNAAHILGATRDALAFSRRQLELELNASQGNPLVVVPEERVISVANFEALPIAMALDLVRLGLAPAVWASAERAVKLLETPWSGLPTGLTELADTPASGLVMLGVAVQAIAVEARSLAHPVSLELTSTSHAEGIEDRTTMAPLSARRAAEMISLVDRVVAIELVVGAQAVDLRGQGPTGRGARRTHAALREVYPFMAAGDVLPVDLEPVVALVRSGRISAP